MTMQHMNSNVELARCRALVEQIARLYTSTEMDPENFALDAPDSIESLIRRAREIAGDPGYPAYVDEDALDGTERDDAPRLLAECKAEGTFEASGTGVNTALVVVEG